MTCLSPRGLKIIPVLILVLIMPMGPGGATQLDYKGSERITNQVWELEFVLPSMGEENFSVRLPFPDYTYTGKWATYSTHEVSVAAVGECGPILYELHHYNEGYSNQGVWLKIVYPCPRNWVFLTVKQSAKLDLPGIDYPLTYHTNNPWMDGTDIVDAYSPVVSDVLSEALAMTGDWHERGGRSVPEKIVNWMNENMSWSGDYVYYPKSASQVLTEREGHCVEWAHAACALLIRAGIPAKVVMSGSIPTYNSTIIWFEDSDWHLGVAYWDGFGWILIDPQATSGFTIVNRVILGADQDSWNLRLITYPEYLYFNISDFESGYQEGNYSGDLYCWNSRCSQYPTEILEHFEYSSGSSSQGSEPMSNIVPNTLTDTEDICPYVAELEFVNYPNPFNPVTTFRFNVNQPGMVKIDLYSVEGRYIKTVYNGCCEPGRKEITWNCSSIPSGVYFARIAFPSGTASRKVIILR